MVMFSNFSLVLIVKTNQRGFQSGSAITFDEEMSGESPQELFEVERILDARLVKGRKQYLVRWKGYSSDEDSWEPARGLRDAREAVSLFNKEQALVKKQAASEKQVSSSQTRRISRRSTSRAKTPVTDPEMQITEAVTVKKVETIGKVQMPAKKVTMAVKPSLSAKKIPVTPSTRGTLLDVSDSDMEDLARSILYKKKQGSEINLKKIIVDKKIEKTDGLFQAQAAPLEQKQPGYFRVIFKDVFIVTIFVCLCAVTIAVLHHYKVGWARPIFRYFGIE